MVQVIGHCRGGLMSHAPFQEDKEDMLDIISPLNPVTPFLRRTRKAFTNHHFFCSIGTCLQLIALIPVILCQMSPLLQLGWEHHPWVSWFYFCFFLLVPLFQAFSKASSRLFDCLCISFFVILISDYAGFPCQQRQWSERNSPLITSLLGESLFCFLSNSPITSIAWDKIAKMLQQKKWGKSNYLTIKM